MTSTRTTEAPIFGCAMRRLAPQVGVRNDSVKELPAVEDGHREGGFPSTPRQQRDGAADSERIPETSQNSYGFATKARRVTAAQCSPLKGHTG